MAGSTSIRRFFHCNSLCGGGKLAELQFQRGEPGAGFGVVSCRALCRHRHIVVHSSLLLYILYRVQVRKALPVEGKRILCWCQECHPAPLDPRTDPDYDANDPGLLLDIDSDYLTVPSS